MNDIITDPAPPLALTVADELRAVIGKLTRRLREEATIGEFTPSQKAVLTRLERDGEATLASLARAEGMRPQSMRSIVVALDAAGFLEATPHPTDGRQRMLSLTPAARADQQAARAARRDWLARSIDSALTSAEQEQVARSIELLSRLVEK